MGRYIDGILVVDTGSVCSPLDNNHSALIKGGRQMSKCKCGDGSPTHKPTRYVEIFGHRESRELSNLLIESSIAFTVEPMPQNFWRFYVKEEAITYVERMADVANSLVDRL